MARPTVAVIGASENRGKYGNIAVRAYRDAGFLVYPIHPRVAEVEGLTAYPTVRDLPEFRVDRASLYVPPAVGLAILDDLAAIEVGEVWLNPGADSPAVVAKAERLGLNVVRACSLVAMRPVG